jgi:hypothetical protein
MAAKRKSKKAEPQSFEKMTGIQLVTAPPNSMPAGWVGCFIALKPDGTIDKKRSGVFKQ